MFGAPRPAETRVITPPRKRGGMFGGTVFGTGREAFGSFNDQTGLLGAKGIATRRKKLLGAPGLTTRSKKLLETRSHY